MSNYKYPDKEAGELPMAIVVKQAQSTLSEAEVMHFVASQVLSCLIIALTFTVDL